MMQLVEELEEVMVNENVRGNNIKAYFGKTSGKFYGLKIISEYSNRNIMFHDLDNIKRTVERMGAN